MNVADKIYVVRQVSTGRFLGSSGRWYPEYPDAQEFASFTKACAAAKKTGVMCEVWEDYGLETEHIALVVHP